VFIHSFIRFLDIGNSRLLAGVHCSSSILCLCPDEALERLKDKKKKIVSMSDMQHKLHF